jgi:hypothetical protein
VSPCCILLAYKPVPWSIVKAQGSTLLSKRVISQHSSASGEVHLPRVPGRKSTPQTAENVGSKQDHGRKMASPTAIPALDFECLDTTHTAHNTAKNLKSTPSTLHRILRSSHYRSTSVQLGIFYQVSKRKMRRLGEENIDCLGWHGFTYPSCSEITHYLRPLQNSCP